MHNTPSIYRVSLFLYIIPASGGCETRRPDGYIVDDIIGIRILAGYLMQYAAKEEIEMKERLQTRAELIDGKSRFSVVMEGLEPIYSDAFPPFGGREGYSPLELFLASLVTCYASTLSSLLRERVRVQVDGLICKASGEVRTEHPKMFEHIDLHVVITSPDAQESGVQRAVDSVEQKLCPVMAMICGNVQVDATFEIRRA